MTLTARRARAGFTLVEMLVSIVLLALLILLVTQVVNTAAIVVRPATKHIDTDTQARTVFDRMAVDFAQMLKRTDIDYYVKGPTNYNGHGNGHGNGHAVEPTAVTAGEAHPDGAERADGDGADA